MTARDALEKLIEGNRRFRESRPEHPSADKAQRQKVLQGQAPFATILSCSDSRVPPEIIFDRGIGELFVIRVAGNIIDSTVKGSLAYAVKHLNCPLIIVLGHSSCGAVTAALLSDNELKDEPVSIKHIVGDIRKNIPKTLSSDSPSESLQDAVCENVISVLNQIQADETVAKAHEDGTSGVKAAYYSPETGNVTFLD